MEIIKRCHHVYLCDPVSVLSKTNKNLIYEIIEDMKAKNRVVPASFLGSWRNFLFQHYFPLIHELAKNAQFEPVTIDWKHCVNFSEDLTYPVIEKIIKQNKVLIALYKGPKWLSKIGHHLKMEDLENKEKTDYLFIMYNPNAPDGRKATVSYHVLKTPKEIQQAELEYKPPITAKTILGSLLALLSVTTAILQIVLGTQLEVSAFAVMFLIIGVLLIFSDLAELVDTFSRGSMTKLVTKHKKTMKGRLDSTQALVYLDNIARRRYALLAKNLFYITRFQNFTKEDVKKIRIEVNKRLNADFTNEDINDIIKMLMDKEFLYIREDNYLKPTISDSLLKNERILDERLYEEFDLPDTIIRHLYHTYRELRQLTLQLCDIARIEPPTMPECKF